MSLARSIPEHGVSRTVTAINGQTSTIEAVYVFRQDFPGFEGHFPANPILPGIAQIMAVVQTVCHDRAGSLLDIKRCKFTRPVRPLEHMKIVVEITEKEARLHCRATLFAEDESASTISLTVAMQE